MIRPTGPSVWNSFEPLSQKSDPALIAVSAWGLRIRMADGATLLCGTSGLWNVNFGYGHPKVNQAILEALDQASYLTLFRFGHSWADEAASALISRCGDQFFSRVIFSTSGSAANDLAMKLVRQAAHLRGERVRRLVVGLKGSYHGMTYGAHSITGGELGQTMYAVDQRFVRHVSPFDESELRRLCESEGDRLCALFLEPVLGTGALEVPASFIELAFALAEEYGFFIVADEIATGFHRTGPFRASSSWTRQPDVVLLSKGLTNGTCAAAAVVVSEQISHLFLKAGAIFYHGETQAGSPSTCAAILAVLDVADSIEASAKAAKLSRALDIRIKRLSTLYPGSIVATGRGCFRGLRFEVSGQPINAEQINQVVGAVRGAGVIIHPGLGGIQIVPAITYEESDIEELFTAVEVVLERVLSAWISTSPIKPSTP